MRRFSTVVLKNRSHVAIGGSDALKYLQGICTIDILK